MNPCAKTRRRLRCLVAAMLLAGTGVAIHADPDDFIAMPGLWKVVTRHVVRGKTGAPSVTWHCVDEASDPWEEYADLDLPASAQCTRADARRHRTGLDWSLHCSGAAAVHARGQVRFDAPKHYTATLALADGSESLQVDGSRHAACTSPSD